MPTSIVSLAKKVFLGCAVDPLRSRHLVSSLQALCRFGPKNPGGHRIIEDLSRPEWNSAHDFIDRKAYSFPFSRFDDALRLVTHAGVGPKLAKQNIRHAFRLVLVPPADWHVLGYQVEGLYFFDVVLPVGSRSLYDVQSPEMDFQQFNGHKIRFTFYG